MGLTAFLLLALKISVALLIFAVGLDSRLKDLTYLQHRPGVMLRSLLAMYVVVGIRSAPIGPLELLQYIRREGDERSNIVVTRCWRS